jgi:hypothetical protein
MTVHSSSHKYSKSPGIQIMIFFSQWHLKVPHAVTPRKFAFYPRNLFVCDISLFTTQIITSVNSIKSLVPVLDAVSVSCQVQGEYLNMNYINFVFQISSGASVGCTGHVASNVPRII